MKAGPMISLFRLSPIPSLPKFEWAPDWCIDIFTPWWRTPAVEERKNDWAIAMTNYGGVIILNQDGIIREWDTAQKCWDPKKLEFGDWIEALLQEGDTFMNES